MRVFAVYDKKSQSYNTPFFCANDDLAKRSFIDLCRDSRTVVALHPEDFDLWHLGTFMEGTACFLQAQNGDHAVCQIMTGVEARIAALKADRFASELVKASTDKVEKNA